MRLITVFSFLTALSLAPATLAQAPIPRPAGPFKITPPTGKPVSVAQFKGDVVMIQFLFTTCSHCQATARTFTTLLKEYSPKGLHIIGAAFDDNVTPAMVTKFIDEQKVGFPVGPITRKQFLDYFGYSVMTYFGVPQIMVIDRKGMVRAQSVPDGSPELQDPAKLKPLLDKLLKEAK